MTNEKPELDIIFEDYYLLVVNKPTGIVTDAANPAQPSVKSMVYAYLKAAHPDRKIWFVGMPHRLDKPVGGILMVAKTPQALKKISQQFAERNTRKIYRAWVQGEVPLAQGKLEHWIGRDELGKKAVVAESETGDFKLCSLVYRVLQNKKNKTLVEIELLTGRYHQIRAQFSYIGHPVVGDEMYGAQPNSWFGLWSVQMGLTHPKTGEEMTFSLPEKWLEKISALGQK